MLTFVQIRHIRGIKTVFLSDIDGTQIALSILKVKTHAENGQKKHDCQKRNCDFWHGICFPKSPENDDI